MKKKVMEKITKVQEYELPVKIAKDKSGFLASCPIWPDCYAQGDTIDEVTNEIVSVASSLIEIYQEENLKIPLTKKTEKLPGKELLFRIPVFVGA